MTAVTAVRVHGIGDLRVESVARAEPESSEAIVRIAYGGICGSDLHYWQDGAVGANVLKAPMTLGHEAVGTVALAAHDGSGPPAGTPVAIHPAKTCGRCRFCASGSSHLCPNCRYLGSAAQWPHTEGGFATELVVPATRLIPLPAGLSLRRASLAEPTAVVWHAVERAAAVGNPVHGAAVVIIGAGPIGLLLTAVVRHLGAEAVTVVDVHPGPLEIAARLGAQHTMEAAELAARPALDADIVFEASGAPAGFVAALGAARRGGAVITVGLLPRVEVGAPAWQIPTNELTIAGSLRINSELPAVLGFLAEPGDIPVDNVITHEFGLDQVPEAFAVAAKADSSSKVLLRFDP